MAAEPWTTSIRHQRNNGGIGRHLGDAVAQPQLKDELSGGGECATATEPCASVQAPGTAVLGRDQKPDAAAGIDPPQAVQDGADGSAAIAITLLRALQDKPAEPPAGGIAWVGMHHIEADQGAA
jgi:hypothetical protein